MKAFIVFAVTLLAVNALPVQEHWALFKAQHGKSYGSLDEEEARFQIFQDNVQKINAHNALYEAGLKTYTMAVNKFADLTSDEFEKMFACQNGPAPKRNLTRHVQTLTAPESMDWRDYSAVLAVRNQGQCGSCWAFSTVGAIEGQNAIKHDKYIPLSPQQLVDCDKEGINDGCSGGDQMTALRDYVIEHGLNSEEDYPYEAEEGRCRAQDNSVVTVRRAVRVEQSEEDLKQALGTVGPISVSLYITLLQFYEGGIFQDPDCVNDMYYLNHALLGIGYGEDDYGQEYWIIKNSWGADWGEDGYLRLARNADQCGIALDCSYPVIA